MRNLILLLRNWKYFLAFFELLSECEKCSILAILKFQSLFIKRFWQKKIRLCWKNMHPCLAPRGNLVRSRVIAPRKSSLEKESASQTWKIFSKSEFEHLGEILFILLWEVNKGGTQWPNYVMFWREYRANYQIQINYLKIKSRRDLWYSLIPREDTFFPRYHNFLFSWKILKRVDKPNIKLI